MAPGQGSSSPSLLPTTARPGLAWPYHGADPLPPPSFQIFAMFFAFCLYYNFD